MQTGIWMLYSGSSHFFDELSYKTLLISSYGLKDIHFARFQHFLAFLEKKTKQRNNRMLFSPRRS
jgi:hypothetical protein